ncbi:hypothetical protein, partial [Salmonella enterica]|uniref:hypothetical protein n=1 Tax=Salmonella enterica TaxID=28901 RepID=UPI001482004A
VSVALYPGGLFGLNQTVSPGIAGRHLRIGVALCGYKVCIAVRRGRREGVSVALCPGGLFGLNQTVSPGIAGRHLRIGVDR